MASYEEYYQRYKARFEQDMEPVTLENTPSIHQLALAWQHIADAHGDGLAYQGELEFERHLIAIGEQYYRPKDDDDDDAAFLRVLFIVGKVAALAAVAVFAPPMLAEAFPIACAAGTVTNAVATGIAVGATDAGAQAVGIGLKVQDRFSASEVLESAVGAAVGVEATGLGLSTALKAAAVGTAAVATQGTEKLVGMRDKLDAKEVGMQIAASLIASGIQKAMPKINQLFGVRGGVIAATAANTALNSVLQSNITGTPIDITSIAANVVGVIAGNNLGDTVAQTANTQKPSQSNKNAPCELDDLLKRDLDKICLIPANDSGYLERLKITPISPLSSTDDAVQLIMQGRFEEAKNLAIDSAKARYISTVTHLPKVYPTLTKDYKRAGVFSIPQRYDINMGESAADKLAKMAQADSRESNSFLDNTTRGPLEKGVIIGGAVVAAAAALPEEIVTAAATLIGRIGTASITGPIPEASMLEDMAAPAIKQLASRVGSVCLKVEDGAGAIASVTVSKLGIFAKSESVEGGKDLVTLYRSVDSSELQQILKTNQFAQGPNSLEGKFFAESFADAQKWGDTMNGIGNHSVVEVKIPKSIASEMMRWERLDGIGPARYGTLDQLKNININTPEVQNINVLSK